MTKSKNAVFVRVFELRIWELNTLEIGINTEVNVLAPIAVRGEVQQFIRVGSKEFDRLQKNRRAHKVGLSYIF